MWSWCQWCGYENNTIGLPVSYLIFLTNAFWNSSDEDSDYDDDDSSDDDTGSEYSRSRTRGDYFSHISRVQGSGHYRVPCKDSCRWINTELFIMLI